MFAREEWLMRPMIGGIALAVASLASAADTVICVPWQGDPVKQHTVISGAPALLKCVVKADSASTRWYKWTFGDGTESAVATVSGQAEYSIEASHTYVNATGFPITATLRVDKVDATLANAVSGNYLAKVEADNTDSRINIAIDTGLWWLYKSANNHSWYAAGYVHTFDNSPVATWQQTSYVSSMVAPTASAVQAFGINGHRIHGDPTKEPYVGVVQGGMNYLTKGYYYNTSYPALTAVPIGAPAGHTSDVTDGNANGYGIQIYDVGGGSHAPYQGGQIMDAIIASGALPTDSTGRDFAPGTATSHVWTYRELLQDMADMYVWGQNDTTNANCANGICGSWWYGWNYGAYGDNSASQWGAIGLLPAQQSPWNVVVPNWVKQYNANFLEATKCNVANGNLTFGYTSPCSYAGDAGLQTTTSGMVQMIFDGQLTTDPKWAPAQKYVADLWQNFTHGGSSWGGYKTYGWYSFAKAMRLAKPSPVTQIVKTSGATFDWYYGNPSNATCTTEANCEKGLARRILETQTMSGANTGAWESGNLTNAPLTTAWMIITLRPTLFAAAPIACFSASPNPSFSGLPVSFNPSCSGHSEAGKTIANLTKFEWDFDNSGTFDASTTTPTAVTHAFTCAQVPCHYPVMLKVTDDNNPALSATTIVTVDITDPPHPPVAKSDGPYMVSMCPADTLTLDGSASYHPDQGMTQSGCPTCTPDTITAWDWDVTPPLNFTPNPDASGVKQTLANAAIASYFKVGSNDIALRVTDNSLLAFPGSGNTSNLSNTAYDTVTATNACMCDLAARPKSGKVQLTWAPVAGAASYDIYRSTVGANTGFAKIVSGVVTTYATYLDVTAVNGTKYYYRVVANTGCGSTAVGATAGGR